jgi:ADP-heptose:LPS heptosyltransferase
MAIFKIGYENELNTYYFVKNRPRKYLMSPLKNIIKHSLYSLRDLRLPEFIKHKKEKSLAILRMDAIGDYILFRNFIECIKTSEKYKEYDITLIGNEIWKSIAMSLDAKWLNRFIWVNSKKFQKDFSYRKSILQEVEDTHYSVLFHPTFSPDYYVAEALAKRIHADYKIACKGDAMNMKRWQKKLTTKSYDHFIAIDKIVTFEFDQNKAIVEAFLGEECDITKPSIDPQEISPFANELDDYMILFIGGNSAFRKWSMANWKGLIAELSKIYKGDIVLAGGPDDKEKASLIADHFTTLAQLKNYCGKTSLLDLISIISRARGMISNETSAAHMAVALDTPVLVLSNGNHYGRFSPYPVSITGKYRVLYPDEIESLKEEATRIKTYGPGSRLNINSITVRRVFDHANSF